MQQMPLDRADMSSDHSETAPLDRMPHFKDVSTLPVSHIACDGEGNI